MQTYHIVAGFSEIKFQLRTQNNLIKPLEELRLWFSFEEDVLYVHDFDNHDKCIALAVYNKSEKAWQIVFRGGAYGRQVIENAINSYDLKVLAISTNNLYKSHGYIGL